MLRILTINDGPPTHTGIPDSPTRLNLIPHSIVLLLVDITAGRGGGTNSTFVGPGWAATDVTGGSFFFGAFCNFTTTKGRLWGEKIHLFERRRWKYNRWVHSQTRLAILCPGLRGAPFAFSLCVCFSMENTYLVSGGIGYDLMQLRQSLPPNVRLNAMCIICLFYKCETLLVTCRKRSISTQSRTIASTCIQHHLGFTSMTTASRSLTKAICTSYDTLLISS